MPVMVFPPQHSLTLLLAFEKVSRNKSMHWRKTLRVGSLCTVLWTKREEKESENSFSRAFAHNTCFLSRVWVLFSSSSALIQLF